MTELARSTWLRIYSGATTYQRWQNAYLGQTINGHSFMPFEAGAFELSDSGDQSSLEVRLPATADVIEAVEAALAAVRLCEVRLLQYPQPTISNTLPASPTLLATFVGEIIGAQASLATITLQLGSSLSPVGAQIPPRKFSPDLIGFPIRL